MSMARCGLLITFDDGGVRYSFLAAVSDFFLSWMYPKYLSQLLVSLIGPKQDLLSYALEYSTRMVYNLHPKY